MINPCVFEAYLAFSKFFKGFSTDETGDDGSSLTSSAASLGLGTSSEPPVLGTIIADGLLDWRRAKAFYFSCSLTIEEIVLLI